MSDSDKADSDLVGIVIGDKLGFKSHGEQIAKPIYSPNSDSTTKSMNKRRRIQFFDRFFLDLGKDDGISKSFQVYFDFEVEKNVDDLKRHFFDVNPFKRNLDDMAIKSKKWRKIRRFAFDLEKKRRDIEKKKEFIRSLMPNFGEVDRIEPKMNSMERKKLWKWFRSQQNIVGFVENSSRETAFEFLHRKKDEILSLFSEGYSALSIRDQIKHLAKSNPLFSEISTSTYRKFIKNYLNLKFGSVKFISMNSDSEKTRRIRKMTSIMLLYSLKSRVHVIFFDESTVAQSSFKHQVWRENSLAKICIERRTSNGTIKILIAMNRNQVLNFWISKKTNSSIIASFLWETVNEVREKNPNERIVLFIDNSMMHKTTLMKKFAEENEVYILFNAPNSSKSMPVEYIFEKIKRGFRTRIGKNRMENIGRSIFEASNSLSNFDVENAFAKSRKWIEKAVDGESFWLKE